MEYSQYSPTRLNTETHPHLKNVTRCWKTKDGVYNILYARVSNYEHLRIRRIDDQPIHSYMDLQEIKNDILGEDTVAIEIYPKQTDFKNGSNTYHIWACPDFQDNIPNLEQLYDYPGAPTNHD